MHGRWSVPVRLHVNHWSWVMLVVVFAVSANTLPTRSSPSERRRFGDEDDEVREELEAIKERILSDLGLSEVPDISGANVSASQMETMLELYRRRVMESEQEDEEMEQKQPVLRYYSYADIASSEHTTFRFSNNPNFKRIRFPIHTSLWRKGQYLQSAKLRIPLKESQRNSHIVIYRILEEPFTPNFSRALVIDQVVEPTLPRHAELDILDTVRQWLDNPELNFGLLLDCQGCWNASAETAVHQEYPVLDTLVSELPSRVKRSNRVMLDSPGPSPLDCTKGLKTRKCCRRSLTVSFQDIGWDWIIQPTKFEAYFCKGKCQNRSNSFATAHAFVQSFLYRKGYKVPRPCCAPKKLKALNLLHYNNEKPPRIVMTQQKGMIVKECACS